MPVASNPGAHGLGGPALPLWTADKFGDITEALQNSDLEAAGEATEAAKKAAGEKIKKAMDESGMTEKVENYKL